MIANKPKTKGQIIRTRIIGVLLTVAGGSLGLGSILFFIFALTGVTDADLFTTSGSNVDPMNLGGALFLFAIFGIAMLAAGIAMVRDPEDNKRYFSQHND